MDKDFMILFGSDFHFNFLQYSTPQKFGERIIQDNPESLGIIITGDISTGKYLIRHLQDFARGFTKPIWFVLGNHDYYDSSWEEIDSQVLALTTKIPNLYWLNEKYHIVNNHVICGVDGWYDAYYGNTNSTIELNDFYDIKELNPGIRYRSLLIDIIRNRAGYEADRLAYILKQACDTDNEVIIVATHIAPYIESAWHQGKPSDRDWLPWFTSASTGAVLDIYANKYPNKKFIVLCGHSHSSGIYQRTHNMIIYTSAATYCFPEIGGSINTNNRIISANDSTNTRVDNQY